MPVKKQEFSQICCGFALVDELGGELFPGRQEGADGSRQIPDFSKERETDIPKDL